MTAIAITAIICTTLVIIFFMGANAGGNKN